MLFKVATRRAFAEEEDRIGVIEAQGLDEAVEKLKKWAETNMVGTDLQQLSGPDVELADGWATASFRLRWVPDDADAVPEVGCDEYVIKQFAPSLDPDILMFLAEDWHEVFSPSKTADHGLDR